MIVLFERVVFEVLLQKIGRGRRKCVACLSDLACNLVMCWRQITWTVNIQQVVRHATTYQTPVIILPSSYRWLYKFTRIIFMYIIVLNYHYLWATSRFYTIRVRNVSVFLVMKNFLQSALDPNNSIVRTWEGNTKQYTVYNYENIVKNTFILLKTSKW